MSDVLRCPVCSCAHLLLFAHEIAGAARIRHSLRPLISRGRRISCKPRAQCVARMLSAVIVREGGRSSIPETSMIEPRSRGVLGPRFRGGRQRWVALRSPRHCEERLRRSNPPRRTKKEWIASSQELLAMTADTGQIGHETPPPTPLFPLCTISHPPKTLYGAARSVIGAW